MRGRKRRNRMTQQRIIIGIVIVFFAGCLLGSGVGRASEKRKSKKRVEEAVAKVQKKADDTKDSLEKQIYELQEGNTDSASELPWYLTLVSGAQPMESGYVPELKELQPGHSVDTRIVDAAKTMLADAEKAGLHVQICSAYRSVDKQKTVFGDSMKRRVNSGMNYWDAYYETTKNVALPGTSEHALGLALDLVSSSYTGLDERQKNTAEAKWLAENCHKYGFILRYPEGTTDITGIVFEPWHYRYVGEEHAQKIMELGITLEEYLEEHYDSKAGGK